MEFISPAKNKLDNFEKSLSSIIARLKILNNDHKYKTININLRFIQLTFDKLHIFKKLFSFIIVSKKNLHNYYIKMCKY